MKGPPRSPNFPFFLLKPPQLQGFSVYFVLSPVLHEFLHTAGSQPPAKGSEALSNSQFLTCRSLLAGSDQAKSPVGLGSFVPQAQHTMMGSETLAPGAFCSPWETRDLTGFRIRALCCHLTGAGDAHPQASESPYFSPDVGLQVCNSNYLEGWDKKITSSRPGWVTL